jgi:AraC family transcriptional regulator of adaptative response/methylated-DNA-[protein]-cysteine methyltransferase
MNTLNDARWRAIESRDDRPDGVFFYGVSTTGIYCRPGCASRRPLRKNVDFFVSPFDAVEAGYRACHRCRPDREVTVDPALAAVIALCRLLEAPSGPRDVARVLAGAVRGESDPAVLPLDLEGTAFQIRVWEALREIPSGQTTTYAQVAKRIGAPSAVRAVASAIAANPVALVIPCHRVIRSDGSLGGYRWGLATKEALLDSEAAFASR